MTEEHKNSIPLFAQSPFSELLLRESKQLLGEQKDLLEQRHALVQQRQALLRTRQELIEDLQCTCQRIAEMTGANNLQP